MKENKKTWFIIIGIALLIALIIFLLTRPRKKEYNKFTFPTTLVVKNSTPNRMADTITMVILNKVMGYDTMNVRIFPMPPVLMSGFTAILQKIDFEKHTYTIFLQTVDVETMKVALSHELFHLKQHELGFLVTLPNNYGYVWKGDTAKYSDVLYENRPYEIEAYERGPQVYNSLNKILYKKK